MSQTIVTLDLPDEIKGSPLEQKFQATVKKILHEQAVLRLYQDGEISTETGAKLLGINLYEFIRFLSRNNVAIIDLSEEELAQDLVTAQAAFNARQKENRSDKQ